MSADVEHCMLALYIQYFVYTLMNCYEDYGKLMWAVM